MSSLHVMVLGVSNSCESSCSLGLWLTWLMSAWLAMSFDPSTMCSRPGWGVIMWSLRTSSHESRTLPSWFVVLNVIGSGLRPGYFMNTCKLPKFVITWVVYTLMVHCTGPRFFSPVSLVSCLYTTAGMTLTSAPGSMRTLKYVRHRWWHCCTSGRLAYKCLVMVFWFCIWQMK